LSDLEFLLGRDTEFSTFGLLELRGLLGLFGLSEVPFRSSDLFGLVGLSEVPFLSSDLFGFLGLSGLPDVDFLSSCLRGLIAPAVDFLSSCLRGLMAAPAVDFLSSCLRGLSGLVALGLPEFSLWLLALAVFFLSSDRDGSPVLSFDFFLVGDLLPFAERPSEPLGIDNNTQMAGEQRRY